ncbi:RNA polymerase sigma factor, sigma-70 family [Singulisphaera sp. GP187]|nr:RNA polymerase sigma factor, sigma-70 family [Singulisphaera sp. GP187]
MDDDGTFAQFLHRVRAGDEAAAAELVRRYEPAIRLEARLRLGDTPLRRVLDSMDICQSVLNSFFVRAAVGQYDLERPEQLIGLLVVIARNKVIRQARRQQAGNRDARRNVALEDVDLAATDPSPSQVAAGREMLEKVKRLLSDEERRLADLRGEGRQWAEIAAELGGTPQGRRKQFTRAIDRIAGAVGLEEATDG